MILKIAIITAYIIGVIIFTLSLPAVIEITMFIIAALFKKKSENKKAAEKSIKIGVVIPAHNEEKNIERCVKSIRESEAGIHKFEIIVVADNCDDNTAENAEKAGARALRRFNQEKRGKGAAIDYAFNILLKEDYDAFMIVDADTVVGNEFIKVSGDSFAAGEDAIQCGNLVLNRTATQRTRFINLALLSMNFFRPSGRERMGISAGIQGNGFGLSKKLIMEVPYSANSITEDLEYHIKLIESGKRVKFVPETVVLSDFPLSDEGNETQRARWEGGRFLLQRTYGPKLILKILSGKLRITEPFLELMSMPLSYEVMMLFILLILPFWEFRLYSLYAMGIIAIHVVMAVVIYGDRDDFKALKGVPEYIFWKIVKLPVILANARKNVKWVRTKRD